MPASRIASSAWNRIGAPATGISCFAFVCVSGRRRDPSPPARISARIRRLGAMQIGGGRPAADGLQVEAPRDEDGDRAAAQRARRHLQELQVGEVLLHDLGVALMPGLVRDDRALHVGAVRRVVDDPGRDVEPGIGQDLLDVVRGPARVVVDDRHDDVRLGRSRRLEVDAQVPERLALADASEDLVRDGLRIQDGQRSLEAADGGHRPELHRAGRDALELLHEIDDVRQIEPLRRHQVPRDRPDQRRGFRDLARREEAVEDGTQELLLAADPGEVGDQVARLVPGPHVRERLERRRASGIRPGRRAR